MYDAESPDLCNNDVVKAARESIHHIIHVGIIQLASNIFYICILS